MAEPDEATLRKEQRRLLDQTMDDTIRGSIFVSNIDEPRTVAVPSKQELEKELNSISERLALVNGASNELKAHVTALELIKNRDNTSRIEIKRVEDRSDELTVSHFLPGMNIEQGATLADILGDTFKNYPFGKDKLKQAQMEHLLIDYAMKIVQARRIPPVGPGRSPNDLARDQDLKKAQLDLLMDRYSKINLISLRKEQEDQIVKRSKFDLLRANTIAANRSGQMVPCPAFGKKGNLHSDVFKKLLANMNNVTFGSAHTTQDLKSYLEIVKSVCENEYNEKATYQALLYVLCLKPKKMVEHCHKENHPLSWAWNQLQIGWGRTVSNENYDQLIKEAMHTRPVNIPQDLLNLASLIREKNDSLDPEEKASYNNVEIKRRLLKYLNMWFPYHISQIEQRFQAICLEKIEIGGLQPPPDHTLSSLAESILTDVPPARLTFEQPRKPRSHFNEMEAEERHLEDRFLRLAVDEPQGSSVHAFEGNDGRRGNFGGPNRPRRQGLIIPPEFRDRCLKCGDNNHFYKWCPKYKGNVQSTPCEYCGCYHVDTCLNARPSKVNEMSTPRDPFMHAVHGDDFQ